MFIFTYNKLTITIHIMTRDYSEKISYYRFLVNKSIEYLDVKKLKFYTTKLSYFLERQKELDRKKFLFETMGIQS
jgi:hypothetical protein